MSVVPNTYGWDEQTKETDKEGKETEEVGKQRRVNM